MCAAEGYLHHFYSLKAPSLHGLFFSCYGCEHRVCAWGQLKNWNLDWKPWIQFFFFCNHLGRIFSKEMLLEKKYISRRLSELAVCLTGGRLTGVFVYLFIYFFNNLTVSWPADTVRVPPGCRPPCAAGWKQSRVRPTSSSTAILFDPLMWKKSH